MILTTILLDTLGPIEHHTRKDNDEHFNYASLDKMILKKENYDKYETKYNLLVLRLLTHFVQI